MRILLLLIFSVTLFAHPNPTIYYRIFFKFDGIKVTDIGESWTFDKETSEELLKMYGLKKGVSLDKKKSAKVGEEIMKGVAVDRYFTYISKDRRDLGEVEATNFKAEVTKDLVSVVFINRLPSPIDVSKSTLSMQVKDPTEGIKTKLLEKNPVVLMGKAKNECDIKMRDIANTQDFRATSPLIQKEISLKCGY